MTTTVGERLREWREAQNPKIKQSDLAKKMGVKQPTLSGFERKSIPLGDLPALIVEQETGGVVMAWECVSPGRAERVKAQAAKRKRAGRTGRAA